ncbi:ubiquitinyl hydrolase 1 [Theileria orientalis]|uniref:ubiquitinyl hydrolase 1 n=1 Tax=Theileria orientalis TaxID=68886 RepID=A0A976MD49_THEOR|nr:ubiquitinyl hydrolase 1 [Theileria orientalis]
MSKFKTNSPIIIELHNKDIKFKKYESKQRDSFDKSNAKNDKTVLVKKQFKIVNNLSSIKGIYKVPNVKYDDETITMGSGLNNPGINICYMNVIIQVLSHTPLLSSALLKSYHTKVCKNHENNIFCVMCLFEKHLKNSYMASNALNNPFYSIAKKYIYSKFKLNQQDDSFIFLKYFLDSLSKSCYFSSNTNTNSNLSSLNSKTNLVNRNNSVEGTSSSTHGKGIGRDEKRSPSEEAATNLNSLIITNDKIMHTFIGYLFGGYFRNVIICNRCNSRSEKVEEFFDISVETTKSNELINLLNDFVVPEQLEGSNKYYCSECKSLQNATKLLSIYKCPQILTVHLKRFNMNQSSVSSLSTKLFQNKTFTSGSGNHPSNKGNGSNTINNKIGYFKGKFSKLMKRIHFPHKLSISLETKKDQKTWINYEIYAIVCHLGHSLNSGHYITFIKGKNNFWFLFDDSTVRLVSNEYVQQHENDVYILFYSSVSTSTKAGMGSKRTDVCSDFGSVDNMLNEYSQTNKFCNTSKVYDIKAEGKVGKMSSSSSSSNSGIDSKSGDSSGMDEAVVKDALKDDDVSTGSVRSKATDADNISGTSTGVNSDDGVSSSGSSSSDTVDNDDSGVATSGNESVDSSTANSGSESVDPDVASSRNESVDSSSPSTSRESVDPEVASTGNESVDSSTANSGNESVDISGAMDTDDNKEIADGVIEANATTGDAGDDENKGSDMDIDKHKKEEGTYKLIHVLSKVKGKLFNTFIKFRKFKSYKLMTIKLLSNAYRIYTAISEDASSIRSSSNSETPVNNTTEPDARSDYSNVNGTKWYSNKNIINNDDNCDKSKDNNVNKSNSNSFNKNNNNNNIDAKDNINRAKKCSLKSMFRNNEVDVWSDEEDKEKIENYKRLYSSLEGDGSKPDEEELEYDKGRPRKFKKKLEDEKYEFKRHHTGVQIAVNQKDVFDSTAKKASRNNKSDGTKKHKKNKTKRKKKKYTKHK